MPVSSVLAANMPSDIVGHYDLNALDLFEHPDFRSDYSSPNSNLPTDANWTPDPVALHPNTITDDIEDESDAGELDTDPEDAQNGAMLADAYDYSDPGPVGTGDYVVSQGECLASIAKRRGFFWQTLWDLPENRELREARKDPNVLLPGDRLHIPELRPRIESCVTEQRHLFVRKGARCPFRMTIMDYDKPRSNDPYRLNIDGTWYEGALDKDGTLDIKIPANAATGKLYVGAAPLEEVFDLQFGVIDPSVNVAGIQKRLQNLGFDCGAESTFGRKTRAALGHFQDKYNLKVTGKLDDDSRSMLEEEHLSV